MTTMGVYAIENLANGKYYIGSAVSMAKRWNHHTVDLIRGTHHSRYLQRAWNKYGPEAFLFYCLEVVEQAHELTKREQTWISEFKAITKGWANPASRIKGSEASKKRFSDPAERAKLSDGQRKRYEDPAARAKTSEATKKGWIKRRAAALLV